MEQEERKILPPHTYPFWIKGGLATCLIILCIFLRKLPECRAIGILIKNGEAAFNTKNYVQAHSYFQKLLEYLPNNRYFKARFFTAAKEIKKIRAQESAVKF